MKHPWSPQHFAHEALDARCKPEVIEAALDAALAIKRANEDLPVIFTLEHLGHLIDVNAETLRSFVDRRDDPYRIFRVKKRPRPGWGAAPPRASRTICVPSPALMHTQRWIAQNILNAVVPHPASFAFAPGRSLLDAASHHAGCSWLIKLDVRNFFEAISERRVYRVFRELGYGALISFELARICTRSPAPSAVGSGAFASGLPYPARPQGFLPQGAPSSPMLSLADKMSNGQSGGNTFALPGGLRLQFSAPPSGNSPSSPFVTSPSTVWVPSELIGPPLRFIRIGQAVAHSLGIDRLRRKCRCGMCRHQKGDHSSND
jgi:RNA-directed DNA polymerase